MRNAILGALSVLGLLAGCDGQSRSGTGAPLPPSKEVSGKNQKGKLVSDELPSPPGR
jgi:hypothetical protein